MWGLVRIILLITNALVLAIIIYKWNSQLERLPSLRSLVRRQRARLARVALIDLDKISSAATMGTPHAGVAARTRHRAQLLKLFVRGHWISLGFGEAAQAKAFAIRQTRPAAGAMDYS
jgi:hypothetical protein